ncbi:hypothetical protein ACSBR2_039905 [Camellia fascicularis]
MYRHESKFIQIIVQEIVSKLDFTVLSVTPYQIGIDSHVKDINLWFQGGLNNVSVMVICGMGGIGKTTIAKIIITKTSTNLKRQLVLDILKWNKERIYCVAEGINKIKDAMCCKRVLAVLDDVDDLDQVNALLGMRDWLHPRSKIMITTRHVQLLKADEVYKSYVVKELNDDEALYLFSRHAFGQDKPIEAYMEHSKRLIHRCGGLPLALEVLGSSLSGETIDGTATIEGLSLNLEAMPAKSASESFSESDEDDLKTDACSQMHTSRLLQLNNVRLSGGYQKFPKKLRWLCWHGFPLKSIPNDFTLDSLFALEMQNSSLEQLGKRTKLPNLERLILKYCINLVEIHESIGELGTLVLLNLEGCKNLRKLPKKVFLVKSLELILSGCSMLDGLPLTWARWNRSKCFMQMEQIDYSLDHWMLKLSIPLQRNCINVVFKHIFSQGEIPNWLARRVGNPQCLLLVLSGADVVGKSKGLQWMYMPAFIGKILNQLMEDDDEVDVSVDAGEAFLVKELGIHVLM